MNEFYNSIPRRKKPVIYGNHIENPICVNFIYCMDLFSSLKMQGIYLLYNEDDNYPVYIGKSKYIGSRIRQHYNGGYGRQFKYFLFCNMDEYDYNVVEKVEIDLIRKLKPKQNIKVL
jgi:hypothetical protein